MLSTILDLYVSMLTSEIWIVLAIILLTDQMIFTVGSIRNDKEMKFVGFMGVVGVTIFIAAFLILFAPIAFGIQYCASKQGN